MKVARLLSIISAGTLIALSGLRAGAAEPTQENLKFAGYYFAYPHPGQPLPKLTAAPAGYEPFHLEHYGRHGSRWHIGEWVYRSPIDLLRPAERNGKLTERGKLLMEQLRKTEKQSRKRSGELTQLGADQHRGIARRLTANFPEIFKGNARVDAKSTEVIRCILSMDNELQELKAYNPELNITSDASASTMYYLNFEDTVANRKAWSKQSTEAVKKYMNKYPYDLSYINLLVSDPQLVADSINARELLSALFRVASNAQSLDEPTPIYDLLTEQNLENLWRKDNATWYIQYGNTALSEGTGPLRQRYLMRNLIESADTSIMRAEPSANMRFGHDVVVVPFACLLGLDGLDRRCDDLEEASKFFRTYELTPMAANIQMVFYRPKGKSYTPDDVLVKVLYNEKEVTLPGTPVTGPYYRWTDLRKTYLDRIGDERYPVNDADY